MMLSHPHPELFPPKKLPPHPQPSLLLPLLQQQSRIRIHIMELHPNPLRLFVLHPQFVAVKSLIVFPPEINFFIYGLYYEAQLGCVYRFFGKIFYADRRVST